MSVEKFSPFQAIKNILSNIARFVIDILISLWYTPFLIRNLGSELFGFIPLANSVANFLGIITNSLNLSTGRYLTIELEKNNTTQANQIFNTTLLGTLLLISAALPFGSILIILAPDLFNMPPGSERDIQFLFLATITAFLFTTLRINFLVATFARNRFDLRNIVSLTARIGQVLLIVTLFSLDTPKLPYVGIGALLASILALTGDYYLWKRLLPTLDIDLKAASKKYFHLLVGTGAWMFVYQVGAILLLDIEIMVANRVLILNMAGMYGALLTIPKNLRIIAKVVGGVWGPTILSKYSKSDFLGMNEVVKFAIKLIGLSVALPIGFLSGLAKPFLTLWLGPEYAIMSWIFFGMIIHLSVNLIESPFFYTQVSLKKVKFPALVALTLGVINCILTIILGREFGPLGIMVAVASTLTMNHFVILPVYTARIMNLAWWTYIVRMLAVALVTLGVSIVCHLIGVFIPVNSWVSLFVVGLCVSLVYLLIVFLFGLNKEEKDLVFSLIWKIGSTG